MHTEGFHKAMAFSAIVFMLFGGYFAYASFISGQPSSAPFIQPVTASDDDEDEDGAHEKTNQSESSDNSNS